MGEDELAHGQVFRHGHFGEERLVGQGQLLDPAVAPPQELAAHVVVGQNGLNALLGGLAQLGAGKVDGNLVYKFNQSGNRVKIVGVGANTATG